MRRSRSEKKVFVIVGMPGAGKSLASQVAKRMKIPVFVSGDVIRSEALRRGLSPNKKNLGQVMVHIRRTDGMGAVARRLVPLIEQSAGMTLVYEGARSMEEVEELARHYNVSIIAIHASPETRYRRLLKRKERDKRELKVGVGRIISLADRMVENEESIPTLERRMRRVLKTLA